MNTGNWLFEFPASLPHFQKVQQSTPRKDFSSKESENLPPNALCCDICVLQNGGLSVEIG